jgi:hypothetical protein
MGAAPSPQARAPVASVHSATAVEDRSDGIVRIAVQVAGAIRHRFGARSPREASRARQPRGISAGVVISREPPTSGRCLTRPKRPWARRRCVVLLAPLGLACEPDLAIGETTCWHDAAPDGGRDPEPRPPPDAPVPSPWSTGYESGFCDFLRQAGYCYVNTEASHEIVREPVHSGRYAAAFTVSSDDALDALQARCVRWGVLPEAASYEAWYFVPSAASDLVTWNLFHFEGWTGTTPRRLWDVSIESASGEPRLFVYDFLRDIALVPATAPAVPLGRWFRIRFFWRRAADATGAIGLYQDEQMVVEREGIVTDDTERGEWYVGNFTDGLTPRESTVYVDDVSIRSSP